MTDPYQLLGVSPDASEEEVTKAYRALARRYHPDIHPNDKEAERKMKDINAAYEQIKNIKSGKAQYSRQTGYTEAPQGAGRARRFLWIWPLRALLRLLRVWKRAKPTIDRPQPPVFFRQASSFDHSAAHRFIPFLFLFLFPVSLRISILQRWPIGRFC